MPGTAAVVHDIVWDIAWSDYIYFQKTTLGWDTISPMSSRLTFEVNKTHMNN